MRLQYQGYDSNGKFKSFEIYSGLFDIEVVSMNVNIIWTESVFLSSLENITRLNLRLFSFIPNTLYMNEYRFDIQPGVVLNACLENLNPIKELTSRVEIPYSPPSDGRVLGVMLYGITVDGTDLF